jgi:uncharacterized protein YkwD
MRKSIWTSVLVSAGLLLWAPGAGACPGAKVPAGGESAAQGGMAIACLVNELRQKRNLHAVNCNLSLAMAALAHSNDMTAQNFFGHDGDGTLLSRTEAAGFHGSSVGETLAYGTGALGSPKSMVRAWMQSAEHRHILLMRRWRQIGVGVSFGSPTGPDVPGEATYTADFGH